MQSIYLDHAAATPVDARVLAAMQSYWQTQFYNPSAAYLSGRQVRADLEAARSVVAQALGARTTEIIFTAGATESNNLAIHGVMRAHPGKQVVVSAIEHAAVLEVARYYDAPIAPVSADGQVHMSALQQLVNDETVLVSVMYANNEIGTVQPLREVAAFIQVVRKDRLVRKISTPLYLHTDATQAPNYLDVHVSRLGVDFMTLNGGKIYGPKQSGILYVRTGSVLTPLIDGGGQERGLRSGTENVAGSIGFATALMLTQAMRHDEIRRLNALQRRFFDRLQKSVPSSTINGSRTHRLPNSVHVTIPGQDNERLLMALDEVGIMAAAGSACTASSEEPSHVLRAIGVSDDDARASLRFTMGRSTTEAAIDHTVEQLTRITVA